MALRLGAMYDALLAGQIPEDLAKKASEELANYDDRLGRIERDITVMKWMLGTVVTLQLMTLAGLLGVLWRLVR